MTSARAAVVGCLVVTLAASSAGAQDADALIDRGVELRTRGEDEAALRVFREAWEAQRSPRALAQVALAEQALGRWVDAEAHLAAAIAEREHRWIRRNRRALEDSLGEIRAHVGRIEIQGAPVGAEVLIGATVVGRLPATLRVATGSVTFTVRAEAHASVTRTVNVTRAPLRETVTLASLDVPPSPTVAVPSAVVVEAAPAALTVRPPDATVRRVPTRRYVGYALLGAGAAALVVSGVFFGLNASANGSATDATPTSADPYGAWARFQADENFNRGRSGTEVCELARTRIGPDASQVQDLCSQLSSSATIALAAGVAGGVLAVTGLVLAVTARSTPAAAAPRWTVAPWVAPGVGGAVVGGAF